MACFNGRDILNEESSFYYSKKNNLKHTLGEGSGFIKNHSVYFF